MSSQANSVSADIDRFGRRHETDVPICVGETAVSADIDRFGRRH